MEVVSVPLTIDYSSIQHFVAYSIGKVVIANNPTVLGSLESESKQRLWLGSIHKLHGKHSVCFFAVIVHFEVCPFAHYSLVCCVNNEPFNKMRSDLEVKINIWTMLGKILWESLSGIAWWTTPFL